MRLFEIEHGVAPWDTLMKEALFKHSVQNVGLTKFLPTCGHCWRFLNALVFHNEMITTTDPKSDPLVIINEKLRRGAPLWILYRQDIPDPFMWTEPLDIDWVKEALAVSGIESTRRTTMSWEQPTEEEQKNIKERGVRVDLYAETNMLIKKLGLYSDERGRAAACLEALLKEVGKYEEPRKDDESH
jgi:hypothetical protein